jgi:hypothetical protein
LQDVVPSIFLPAYIFINVSPHPLQPPDSHLPPSCTVSFITPWSTVIFREVKEYAQLVKKFPPFMDPEGSLPCSQRPDNGAYPKPYKANPHPPILFP